MASSQSRRSNAVALLTALVLALAGCGESEPDGYEPDGWFECPNLGGVYRVDDPDLLRLVAPFAVPPDSTELFLLIEHRPNGAVIGRLRRPARLAQAEAERLAERDPRRYREWRQQVRILQGDEQAPPGVAYGEGLAAQLGPFVQSTSELSLSDCAGGWWDSWPLRSLPALPGQAPSRDVAVRLSANESGLLVRTNVATSNDTGFVFFGQSVGYNTYGDSRWQRLLRVPDDTVSFHIDVPAADPAPTAAPAPTLLSRGEALRGFARRVRSSLPAGAMLSILREVQFEPAAVTMPRERMLVELSGTFDGDAADDPFATVLAADPRVLDVEVRRRELIGARRYVLLRFSYDLVP